MKTTDCLLKKLTFTTTETGIKTYHNTVPKLIVLPLSSTENTVGQRAQKKYGKTMIISLFFVVCLDNRTPWNKHNARDYIYLLAVLQVQYTDTQERKSFTLEDFEIKSLHYQKRTKNSLFSENRTESAIKRSRKENYLLS